VAVRMEIRVRSRLIRWQMELFRCVDLPLLVQFSSTNINVQILRSSLGFLTLCCNCFAVDDLGTKMAGVVAPGGPLIRRLSLMTFRAEKRADGHFDQDRLVNDLTYISVV